MRNVVALAVVGIALIALAMPAVADPVRAGFDSNTLARNDDGSTGLVPFGFSIDFYGTTYTQGYVNNNGNVTLDASLWTYTPFDLTSTGRVIIAPFFADVDTRGVGDPVEYGTGTVDGRQAWGVSYRNVAHYYQAPPLNTFQVILIDRSDTGVGNFDIEFNYDQILWEAGTASGGNSQGLGGDSARAGWSTGTGAVGESYELPGSAVNGALLDGNLATGLINNRLNSTMDGRYIFNVRNGSVVDPVPEPASLALFGLGAAGFAVLRRRKRRSTTH